MKRVSILILPALVLAGCGDSNTAGKGDEPNVDIAIGGADGDDVSVKADEKGGSVSINADGVSIKADIPGLDDLDIKSDFDIDGVKLYPGAKITSFKLGADASKPEGEQGIVRFGLSAPAAPAVVLDWYVKAFAAKGVATTLKGSALTGTSKDGDDFTFTLTPDGTGSKGEVKISG